jgi:uncharacterized protein YbjT (DUF2867 family)
LVAGASGQLGTEVVRELNARGYQMRALSRSPEKVKGNYEVVKGDLTDPSSLSGVCDGIDVVLSCAGASMDINNFKDKLDFYAVDHRGNCNLLAEARRAGVGRFVYVSLAHANELRQTAYADSHERFVDELKSSGVLYCVVRPTGFYCFLVELLKFAKKGRGIVIGSGKCRTNPVHERDVARACIDAIEGDLNELCVGGPDTMTREELTRLSFEVLGTKPSIMHFSPGLFRTMILPLRLINRRMHSLMHFGVEVTQIDVIAPVYGRERLRDYFEKAARELG